MMGFGMVLFWFALIGLAVLATRGLFQPNKTVSGEHPPVSAKEILEQRYARGEITQEQFQQMQKDLQ
jgi:putative membrane protein